MFGIDMTMIRAFGAPALRGFMAVVKRVRKSVTEVIAPSDEVQTSLAPIRISTMSGLVATALSAWPFRSATFAPVTPLLPVPPTEETAAGLIAWTRRRELLTVALLPVAHENAVQSLNATQPEPCESYARVIESPSAVMREGGPTLAGAAAWA